MTEIAMVTRHPCIKVIKQFYVLSQKGIKVHLICGGNPFNQVTGNPDFQGMLESYTHCVTDKQFREAIKRIGDRVKIFQVNNEPNWPVLFVRENVPDVKIIFDIHDSTIWISGEPNDMETLAIKEADCFIVPSGTCKNELSQRTSTDIVVLPPACPLDWYVNSDHEKMGGLISQGGHVSPMVGKRICRDYTELYEQLINNNIEVFAFSPMFTNDPAKSKNVSITEYYKGIGCRVANAPYKTLLSIYGNHDWNLVGNVVENMVWKYVMPNKLYDAIAGGVPSVSFNCPEVDEILNEHGIGMACESVEELVENWDSHLDYRSNLLKYREEYSMENYIERIISLYEN